MKKTTSVLLGLALFVPTLSAHASSNQELDSKSINEDFKNTMQVVKQSIDSNKATNPNDVPEFQEFKSRYSNQELNSLSQKLNADDKSKIANQIENITVGKNETKTLLLEDGTLIISKNKTGEVGDLKNTTNNKSIVSYSVPIYNGVSGGNYYSNVYDEIWGIYKTATFWNKVNFKLYTNYADITSTSASGTNAIYPAQISVSSNSIIGDKTRVATSQYEYQYSAGIQGIPVVQKYISLSNTIKVISNVGNKVNYTTYSSTEGK